METDKIIKESNERREKIMFHIATYHSKELYEKTTQRLKCSCGKEFTNKKRFEHHKKTWKKGDTCNYPITNWGDL